MIKNMGKNKKYFFAVAFALLVPILALADFSKTDWQFKKNIVLPAISEPTYVQVKLDKDISKTGMNYDDVRVVGDKNGETPYQITVKDSSVINDHYSSGLFDQSINPQTGDSFIVLDLGGDGLLHNEIRFETQSENFKKQVLIYASDSKISVESSKWRLLTSNGYIFNFTDKNANFSASGLTVRYPDSSARYVKAVISGSGEGKAVISNASVIRYEVSTKKENILNLTASKSEMADLKADVLTADLGVSGFPTSRIQLSASDLNFNRRVSIQTSNDGQNWTLAAQGYIFSLNTPKFKGDSMSVEYPERRARYIRAIIFNDDNKPLVFSDAVNIYGVSRMLAFETSPGENYSMYYGNEKASAPRYDLARFFQYLEIAKMPEASLSAEAFNTDYVAPKPPELPLTERYPFLLNITLAILVFAVAVFLFFYLRHFYKKPENYGTDKDKNISFGTPRDGIDDRVDTDSARPTMENKK